MKSFRMAAWFLLGLLLPACALGGDSPPAQPAAPPTAPRLTHTTRLELIKDINAEMVYVRTPFPMGKLGLRLKDGVITPNGMELQQLMAMWGPAAKPGDAARISDVVFKDNVIHIEINGGPIKKTKWYQRITISGSGGETPIAPTNADANPRGSFVDVYFDSYIPEMTGPELKKLLRPVFDFESKSNLEAYLETVPPQVKAAIKEHRVLVGMNREMVIYAKGRPPKKLREKEGEIEHEEWIYGEPPQDVDFVRFSDDEVVRVETMKVNGDKVVRTAKEVELPKPEAVAKKEENAVRPANAPSLRRPGEEMPDEDPNHQPSVKTPLPPLDAPQAPGGGPPH
jgi:hypothetical protein